MESLVAKITVLVRTTFLVEPKFSFLFDGDIAIKPGKYEFRYQVGNTTYPRLITEFEKKYPRVQLQVNVGNGGLD